LVYYIITYDKEKFVINSILFYYPLTILHTITHTKINIVLKILFKIENNSLYCYQDETEKFLYFYSLNKVFC
jgi:hypothetical protein